MKESTRNIAVGITMIAGLIGVAILLSLFGYIPAMVERGYKIRVALVNASGLSIGSVVKLNGIPIGKVIDVEMADKTQGGVVATCRINENVALPAGVRISVQSQLLGGSAYLGMDTSHLVNRPQEIDADIARLKGQIEEINKLTDIADHERDRMRRARQRDINRLIEDRRNAEIREREIAARKWRELLPMDGTAVLRGDIASPASQFAAELEQALHGPLDDLKELLSKPMGDFGDIKGDFQKLAGKVDKLSDEWTKVGENVNQLIGPRSAADVDAGKAEGNLASAVQRADSTVKDLQKQIDTLSKEMTALSQEWKAVGTNLRQLTDARNPADVDSGKQPANIATILARADSRMKELETTIAESNKALKRYADLADDVSKEVTRAGKLIEEVRSGEGTAGKLVKDPALYNNLNDAVTRANSVMVELKLMIEKFSKEGVPIQLP